MKKKSPLFAIIGSVDESRNDLNVRDSVKAKTAAKNLGKALGKKGYRILVYSPEPQFIEKDVVQGFIESGINEPESIVVVFSFDQKNQVENFPEYHTKRLLYKLDQHSGKKWRVPYIESFGKADGIILIGGGKWTLTAGSCAIAFNRPLLALPAYGGDAESIWNYLNPGKHLCSYENKEVMKLHGEEYQDAERWVESLENQINNLNKINKVNILSLFFTLFILISWVIFLPIGDWLIIEGTHIAKFLFKFLLFLNPLISGASGASIRTLFNPVSENSSEKTITLGVASGAITSILYVLPQIATNPSPYNIYILGFATIFGFIAGLTFDFVLQRLLSKEVPLDHLPKSENK